jgi:hypothetical protein
MVPPWLLLLALSKGSGSDRVLLALYAYDPLDAIRLWIMQNPEMRHPLPPASD